ncbi:MAG TPA: ATP-dependent Clp protease adaptor ClpS [Gemmataceae bacterium]|jgi:ATP-dependent Clp protease adaptor protein ClpS
MSEPTTLPEPKVVPREKEKVRRQPPYNVILLNDDDHTYEYVVRMLKELFGYPVEKGFKLAEQVDRTGRAVVLTTSREHAELKQEQIHAYGPDPLLDRCRGSMTAVIEPAMG